MSENAFSPIHLNLIKSLPEKSCGLLITSINHHLWKSSLHSLFVLSINWSRYSGQLQKILGKFCWYFWRYLERKKNLNLRDDFLLVFQGHSFKDKGQRYTFRKPCSQESPLYYFYQLFLIKQLHHISRWFYVDLKL